MIGVMPLWIDEAHYIMHNYEVPLIVFSAGVLLIGWAIHVVSNKIDCHDTGCGHGPCTPKKKKAGKVLKIATFLFVINLCVYGAIHYSQDEISVAVNQSHDNHNH